VHVLALHQLLEQGEARFAALLLAGFEGELLRDDGEAVEVPRQVFAVGRRGEGLLDEVADGRGDHVAFVLVVVILLLEAPDGRILAEDAGEIVGDAGLLGDDEGLRHGQGGRRGVEETRSSPISRKGQPAFEKVFPGSWRTRLFISSWRRAAETRPEGWAAA